MGGHKSFRQLSRSSSHRQALLRNLVGDLFRHESISTTYAKAKEAQRLAEYAITLAKKKTPATLKKLRYALRQGGYTRVQRIEPLRTDQAPSAILEFVDGPRDMRFALVAKTIAESIRKGTDLSDITLENIRKVTRFRPDGERELEKLVEVFKKMKADS